MGKEWLEKLASFIEKKPLMVLQISNQRWENLSSAYRGAHEFTIAEPHESFENARFPTACIIIGSDGYSDAIYFGIVVARSSITTLESRIKVKVGKEILPASKSALLDLIHEKPHSGNFRKAIGSSDPVIVLGSKMSAHIIRKLAEIRSNAGHMRAVSNALVKDEHSNPHSACQEDALKMALRAFDISYDDEAISVEVIKGKDTALSGIKISEDSVIQHDARNFPGFEFINDDVTGRAILEKKNQRLEIITANRLPLEKVFGVDLIYFNKTMQNIVMVQYKMLEPHKEKDGSFDWIYYPDAQARKEIKRMKKFSADHLLGQYEYRINQQTFYFKFVRRDSVLGKKGFLVPLDHYEKLEKDPLCKGPRGAVRVSYNSLDGRYLRQQPFYDLIRAGYIGSSSEATGHFKVLIAQTIARNRGLIAAVQSGDPVLPDILVDD